MPQDLQDYVDQIILKVPNLAELFNQYSLIQSQTRAKAKAAKSSKAPTSKPRTKMATAYNPAKTNPSSLKPKADSRSKPPKKAPVRPRKTKHDSDEDAYFEDDLGDQFDRLKIGEDLVIVKLKWHLRLINYGGLRKEFLPAFCLIPQKDLSKFVSLKKLIFPKKRNPVDEYYTITKEDYQIETSRDPKLLSGAKQLYNPKENEWLQLSMRQ